MAFIFKKTHCSWPTICIVFKTVSWTKAEDFRGNITRSDTCLFSHFCTCSEDILHGNKSNFQAIYLQWNIYLTSYSFCTHTDIYPDFRQMHFQTDIPHLSMCSMRLKRTNHTKFYLHSMLSTTQMSLTALTPNNWVIIFSICILIWLVLNNMKCMSKVLNFLKT